MVSYGDEISTDKSDGDHETCPLDSKLRVVSCEFDLVRGFQGIALSTSGIKHVTSVDMASGPVGRSGVPVFTHSVKSKEACLVTCVGNVDLCVCIFCTKVA